MLRSSLYIITIFTIVALGFSCEKEAKTPVAAPFQQSYFVRYLADMGQVKAQAEIWEEGSEGKAYQQPPGGVAFQGSATKLRELPGGRIRYEQNRKMPYEQGAFRFSYRNQDGESIDRTAQMAPIDSFSLQIGEGAELFKIDFFGVPLTEEEELTVFFSDAQNQAATKTIAGPLAGNTVTIARTDFAKAVPGPGYLYLVKKKKTFNQSTGVLWVMEYYTRDKEVVVE